MLLSSSCSPSAFVVVCCCCCSAVVVSMAVASMNLCSEQNGKEANDHYLRKKKRRCVWANDPVIVGAGPSGLATAACLHVKGVPCVILERADCIASLWRHRTYDRLKLHLPKQFCELPLMPFPEDFPDYPDIYQFIEYLEQYAARFHLCPEFNESVESASYDGTFGLWRVVTLNGRSGVETEYVCRWLIVATCENAEVVVPEFSGSESFRGRIFHASGYKTGEEFEGQNVLVVGCGNSGMEMSLDLSNHNANPSIVVRSSIVWANEASIYHKSYAAITKLCNLLSPESHMGHL